MRTHTTKRPRGQAGPSAYEPVIKLPEVLRHVEGLTACISSILLVWKPWCVPQGRRGRRQASKQWVYLVHGAVLPAAVHHARENGRK